MREPGFASGLITLQTFLCSSELTPLQLRMGSESLGEGGKISLRMKPGGLVGNRREETLPYRMGPWTSSCGEQSPDSCTNGTCAERVCCLGWG